MKLFQEKEAAMTAANELKGWGTCAVYRMFHVYSDKFIGYAVGNGYNFLCADGFMRTKNPYVYAK